MKLIIQRFWMVIVLLCSFISASAYDFESGGIYYNIVSMADLEVEVTYKAIRVEGYNGDRRYNSSYEGVVSIPQTVNYNNKTFTVVGVGAEAFGAKTEGSDITGIDLPPTIKVIKDQAFSNCEMLSSINLPESLEVIEDYAFYYSGLENIQGWGNVTTIGSYAFAGSNLKEAFFPTSLRSIGEHAFRLNLSLTQVILNSNLAKIGHNAFEANQNLVEVFFTSDEKPEMVNGVNEIFSSCHSALEFYVPSTNKYGFGKDYVTFTADTYDYSGQPHNIEWSNNLKAYKCEISEDDCKTDTDAGEHTKYLKATYSNGIDFSVEIPFEYTIKKAPMTLMVNNAEREYGEPNPAFTCNISGFVNGESEEALGITPSFECEATTRSKVGNYKILASFDAPNYEITYRYGNLSIVKAPLTLTVGNVSRLYGNPNPNFTMSYSGLKNGETNPEWTITPTITTPATIKSSVGEYTITAKDGEAVNYDITKYTPGNLTVYKRDLTAKAGDYERFYNEKNPRFQVSYIGFVNDDTPESLTEEPVAQCAATVSSDAGTYPIQVSGGEAENYNFVYQDGSLRINPLVVGFKDIYNSVTYNDMSVSTSEESFMYIPTIVGPYNEEDFLIQIWAMDKDNNFPQHVIYISGGDYAGDYVDVSETDIMDAGKYIINLVKKSNNPNVTADPGRAYVTVNRGSIDLKWYASAPSEVAVGDTIDLGITYKGDRWCRFDPQYDKEILELSSSNTFENDPHWYAKGLKEGVTTVYFSIQCAKNKYGFYNFSDSQTISGRIVVLPESGINKVTGEDSSISITVKDGIVHIFEKPDNAQVRIYSLNGMLIRETNEDLIEGLDAGLYIIDVEGKTFKVGIR